MATLSDPSNPLDPFNLAPGAISAGTDIVGGIAGAAQDATGQSGLLSILTNPTIRGMLGELIVQRALPAIGGAALMIVGLVFVLSGTKAGGVIVNTVSDAAKVAAVA